MPADVDVSDEVRAVLERAEGAAQRAMGGGGGGGGGGDGSLLLPAEDRRKNAEKEQSPPRSGRAPSGSPQRRLSPRRSRGATPDGAAMATTPRHYFAPSSLPPGGSYHPRPDGLAASLLASTGQRRDTAPPRAADTAAPPPGGLPLLTPFASVAALQRHVRSSAAAVGFPGRPGIDLFVEARGVSPWRQRLGPATPPRGLVVVAPPPPPPPEENPWVIRETLGSLEQTVRELQEGSRVRDGLFAREKAELVHRIGQLEAELRSREESPGGKTANSEVARLLRENAGLQRDLADALRAAKEREARFEDLARGLAAAEAVAAERAKEIAALQDVVEAAEVASRAQADVLERQRNDLLMDHRRRLSEAAEFDVHEKQALRDEADALRRENARLRLAKPPQTPKASVRRQQHGGSSPHRFESDAFLSPGGGLHAAAERLRAELAHSETLRLDAESRAAAAEKVAGWREEETRAQRALMERKLDATGAHVAHHAGVSESLRTLLEASEQTVQALNRRLIAANEEIAMRAAEEERLRAELAASAHERQRIPLSPRTPRVEVREMHMPEHILHMRSHNERLAADIAGTKRHEAELVARLADAEAAMQGMHQEIHRLTAELAAAHAREMGLAERMEAEGTAEEHRREMARLALQLSAESEVRRLADERVEHLEAKIAQLETQIVDGDAAFAGLKEEATALATRAAIEINSRESAESHLEALRTENEGCLRDRAELAERHAGLAGKHAVNEHEVARLHAEVRNAEDRRRAAEDTVQRLSQSLAQSDAARQSADSEVSHAREQLVVLQARLTGLNDTNGVLEQQAGGYQRALADIRELQSLKIALGQHLSDAERRADDATRRAERAEGQLQVFHISSAEQQQEFADTQRAMHDANGRASDLAQQAGLVPELMARTQMLERALSDRETEVAALQGEIPVLRDELKRTIHDLSQSTQQSASFEQAVAELSAAKNQLQAQRAVHEGQMQQRDMDYAALRARFEDLHERFVHTTANANRTVGDLQTTQTRLDILQPRQSHLEQLLADAEEDKRRMQMALRDSEERANRVRMDAMARESAALAALQERLLAEMDIREQRLRAEHADELARKDLQLSTHRPPDYVVHTDPTAQLLELKGVSPLRQRGVVEVSHVDLQENLSRAVAQNSVLLRAVWDVSSSLGDTRNALAIALRALDATAPPAVRQVVGEALDNVNRARQFAQQAAAAQARHP
ncbi:hypothetical protein DIPPA_13839 [Diplonema papillatum]|nr:hypothetical protein DIPPA_13839 [Diplonema papillatum]